MRGPNLFESTTGVRCDNEVLEAGVGLVGSDSRDRCGLISNDQGLTYFPLSARKCERLLQTQEIPGAIAPYLSDGITRT